MRIKFVDLNIWYGGNLFNEAVKFLQEEDADIITLQEVTDKNFEDLRKKLSYKYFYWEPSLIHPTKAGDIPIGNVIFSKYPITSTKTTFYDRPLSKIVLFNPKTGHLIPRNLLHAEIDVNSTTLNVFTTHGVWGRDDRDNSQRTKMVKIAVNKIQRLKNVILAGDFNVDQKTQAIALIEDSLKNVFKNELITSFNLNWKKEQGFATSVVDFIFVSSNIKVLDHHMPEVNISDHMPLVATLELN